MLVQKNIDGLADTPTGHPTVTRLPRERVRVRLLSADRGVHDGPTDLLVMMIRIASLRSFKQSVSGMCISTQVTGGFTYSGYHSNGERPGLQSGGVDMHKTEL